MSGRTSARILAPAALVATAIALLMILASSRGGDGGAPTAGEREAAPATKTTQDRGSKSGEAEDGAGAAGKRPSRKTYRVQPGDTPSTIAEKAGIPLETLLDLNPDIDPQSLSPGQKLRLR